MAKEHLIRARDLLIEHGWSQEAWHTDNGEYDLCGALMAAHGKNILRTSQLGFQVEIDHTAWMKQDVEFRVDAYNLWKMATLKATSHPRPADILDGLYNYNDIICHQRDDIVNLINRTLERYYPCRAQLSLL